jgi:hypothetical protein
MCSSFCGCVSILAQPRVLALSDEITAGRDLHAAF